MTELEFSEVCKTIQAAYPRDTFLGSQEQYDLWWNVFKDCNCQFLNTAVRKYIQENKYLPSVSDISTRYNTIKSDVLYKKARLREIFYYTRDIYPQAYRGDVDLEQLFWQLVRSETYEECLAKADRIYHHTLDYVRQTEKTNGTWMLLPECMKGGLA